MDKSELRKEFEKRIYNSSFANCGPIPTEETLEELDEEEVVNGNTGKTE